MRKEYKEELEALRKRMEGAKKFAKKLPVFSEQILDNKHQATDTYISFGDIYKNIPLAWGIKRFLFDGHERSVMSANYINYPAYLFKIYINCSCLFEDDFAGLCRENLLKITFNVFYFDELNTTFYATDEQIEPLLEKLNAWYLTQLEEINAEYKKRKIEHLKKELEQLENDKKI